MNAETVEQATQQHTAWKHEELLAYAVAMVRAGLRLADTGTPHFGSDDVPENEIPASPSIAGSAASMLRRAGVIVDYWQSHPDATPPIHAGRRRSKRAKRNGAKVQLYRLPSRSVAESFLSRHGAAAEPRQREFAI